jgi:hypothetical protein
VIKLGEGHLKQPEDVCVDHKEGILYTATRDGWIKRLRRNGNWENWKHIDSSSLLGIATSKDGGLIVCDTALVSISIQTKPIKLFRTLTLSFVCKFMMILSFHL